MGSGWLKNSTPDRHIPHPADYLGGIRASNNVGSKVWRHGHDGG